MNLCFRVFFFTMICLVLLSCSGPFKQLGREQKLMTCEAGRGALMVRDTIVLKDRYLITENPCTNIPDKVDKTAWPSTLLFNPDNSFIFTSDWTANPDYLNSKLTERQMFLNTGQVIVGIYELSKFNKIITLKLNDTDSLKFNWEKTFKIKYSKKQNLLTLVKAKKQRKIESKK
jgi:hypothetical protein